MLKWPGWPMPLKADQRPPVFSLCKKDMDWAQGTLASRIDGPGVSHTSQTHFHLGVVEIKE